MVIYGTTHNTRASPNWVRGVASLGFLLKGKRRESFFVQPPWLDEEDR